MNYQPIVITVQKNVDFNKAFQTSFMHICEHFYEYPTYAVSPDRKKKKKVTFSDAIKVRLLVEQQFEYYEQLIQ